MCYVIALSTRVRTVSGGSSPLIRIMRPCPCGVLERRVVGCRTLDELRDQCLLVGRAAVEVSINANPPCQGSARRRQASRRPRRVGPRRRRGRAELPSPRSPPAAGPGLRNRLDGRPDCPLCIHRVAVQRLCGVLDVLLAVVDSGRRVDLVCDATVVTARTAATRSSIPRVSYPSRSANLVAAEPLPQRGAPQSSKTRGTSPRGPAEPSVAAPGTASGCLSALSAECTHTFGTGWVTVQSRLRRRYLETSPR